MKKLDNAINLAKEKLFSFGHKNEPVIIADIPLEWTPMGVISGDRIRRVSLIKGVYTVVLETPKGLFPKHYHLVHEAGIMLTGKMKVRTPEGEYIVREGEAYNIPSNIWHSVEFLDKSNSAIAQFHPAFEDNKWEAVVEKIN